MRKQLLLIGSTFLISAASPIASAQSPVATSPSAAPAGASGGLEEIVVTARRQRETLQQTPLSITAFGANRLQQMNITRLDDLNKAVPNLNISQSVAYAAAVIPVIRGVGQSDGILTNDSPVALYLDGVYVARDIGALFQFVDLDRIEVLRGPQGSLFGRNTTGGAVSLITKDPSDSFGIQQKVGYASDNEVTLKTVIDTGFIDGTNVKAKIAFEHHQMDGYVTNTATTAEHSPGADDINAVFLALQADITDDFTAVFRFDHTDESANPVDFQTAYAYPAGSPYPPALAYYSQSPKYGGAPYVVSPGYLSTVNIREPQADLLTTLGYSLTLKYDFNDALSVKSISAFRSLQEYDKSILDGQSNLRGLVLNTNTGGVSVQPVSPYETVCTGSSPSTCDNQHQWQISQELQVSGTVNDQIKYVGGLYYFEENVGEYGNSFFTYVASPNLGINQSAPGSYSGKSTSYASFGEIVYTPPILDNALQLTGGLRFTRDEKAVDIREPGVLLASRRFNALSGDATIKYQWTPDIQTYFRFSNAYKAGGFNGREPENPAGYQPETANSYEIGTHAELFERHVRVNADFFYTSYNNQQIATIVSTPTNPANTETLNAGSSSYKGGELELTWVPDDSWLIDYSFGYVDPEYQSFVTYLNGLSGKPTDISGIAKFPYTSKATMNIGVQYSFPPYDFGDLTARIDFGYKSGEVWAANPIANPLNDVLSSQALTDLSANITLANVPLNWRNGTLQVDVYGKNLLNQHLRIQGIDFSGLGFGIVAYNRPMVLGFDVGVKF